MEQRLKTTHTHMHARTHAHTHTYKGIQNRSITCEIKTKSKKLGLGFLGWIMCTHEQAYVRIIKPACIGKIMHTWNPPQKP